MRQALADVMAEVAPRADTERVASFVRGLYDAAIKEEREERDKLLLASQALPPPVTPLVTPAPAPAAAPEPATPVRGTAPDQPAGAISLAALDRAKVPLGPRPAATVVAPGLAFPREEESLGGDFVGRVIDSRYRVLRKIGEGGMGTVYAAEHVEIGKVVAIKILHPQFSTEQELVERFRREARAASRIGHPNIIDVMDFGTTDDGCAYFIMEHLDGIDLADVLSHERRLDPTRSCQIGVQICRALAAAHAAGVIHRDLKPENIFLVARDGDADFVKVLDFGVARSAGRSHRLTNPGIAMGTPEYMAPEQAAGALVDHRGDIYSVGALLYEMVTGQPPQKRDGEVIGPRSLRLQLSEDLDRIIVRALAQDPAHRYQSMSQLEYDLMKSMWGRPRAVADLLGLHKAEQQVERADVAPGGVDWRGAQPAGAAPAGDPRLERGAAARAGGHAARSAGDVAARSRADPRGAPSPLPVVARGGADHAAASLPGPRAGADFPRAGAPARRYGAGARDPGAPPRPRRPRVLRHLCGAGGGGRGGSARLRQAADPLELARVGRGARADTTASHPTGRAHARRVRSSDAGRSALTGGAAGQPGARG